MALETIDRYGAPEYGPIGLPPAGMIFHTPEWGDSPALNHAIACAEWQATPGNTSGGSYHAIIGHEGADSMVTCTVPNHWVAVRSVAWNRAAGGLTSNHTPPPTGVWNPDRFPWIRSILTAKNADAFADPNRWMHQISLGGAAAWYNLYGYPKGLLIRLAEWVLTLERAYGYDSLMTLHRMWQTNRGDSGPLDLPDLIMVEYAKLITPVPVPLPTPQTFVDVPPDRWSFKDIEWAVANGIASVPADRRFRPTSGTTREESIAFMHRLFNLVEKE